MQNMEVKNITENKATETIENKRIFKFDIIRTFAILCVILCHTCEAMRGMINTKSDYLVISFLHTVSRLGVPLFLFLSGALLLKKSIDSDEDVLIFYKKNLLPLVCANSIWVFLYNIFFLLNGDFEFVTTKNVLKELLFLKEVPVTNMWYFPMIIGVYLGIPFIAKIVKVFSAKTIKIILLLLLVSNFIIPNVNIMLRILNIEEYLQLLLNLNFFGGTYGLYIFLGYYIFNTTKSNTRWIIILTIFSFCIAFCKRILLGDIWYDSTSLLICGSCMFILFNKIKENNIHDNIKKVCTYLSKISLALFFIHYIIQTVIFNGIKNISMNILGKLVFLYVGVIIVAIISIKILSKFKFISKYVFRIK